jgi:hypothetical protein
MSCTTSTHPLYFLTLYSISFLVLLLSLYADMIHIMVCQKQTLFTSTTVLGRCALRNICSAVLIKNSVYDMANVGHVALADSANGRFHVEVVVVFA